jgi:multidrug efflux pump subunit AcrB
MWIVRLALRRPYTFVVLSLLLVILGPIVILRTPTDIFPNINIPVVSIVWNYTGLSPQEMTNRITTPFERAVTTTVNDIQHMESQSINGIAVVKVFFQPNSNLPSAVAEVTAIAQTLLRQLPPGTTPPLIITYSASSVPVLQLSLSGQGLSEQSLYDIGTNFIRTQLATVQGASIPFPYGGKQRQVQVDIDSKALQAKGLSPIDVVNAFASQNIILPSGTAKVGSLEYQIETNSSPQTIQELNDLPIKTVNGSTIYVHDVSHVRDGFPPQTNILRVDGQRAALVTIQKTGSSSTLDIIQRVREKLPLIAASLPPQLRIQPLSDQSIFVRGAINGVVREALVAACLTAIMILVFLGSWRSTIIIAVSIPLSILVSIITMSALGETINIMTLGGLALAVGILVDDATVEIENINRNIELGKETEQAILDGAAQIAIPAFVSTLSICIVFDVLPLRGRPLSLRAACRGCRLCHARLVLPLPHHRANHGEVPAETPLSRGGEGQTDQPQSLHRLPESLRAQLRASPLRLPRLSRPVCRKPRHLPRLLLWLLPRIRRRALPLARAGLLPCCR